MIQLAHFDSGALHILGLAVAMASLAYLALAIWSVASFRPSWQPSKTYQPPVSILKPVCGLEPGLYENLRSFCDQDYPSFQVIFGVRSPRDPAITIIKGLLEEFPHRDLSLVIDNRVIGPNLKVSNLANMYKAAKHNVIVISDSDVRVDRDCLNQIVSPLENPQIGAVTCLYRGAPGSGLPSTLGALLINDWHLPAILVEFSLRGIDVCLGPATAVSRKALDAIGGFDALAHHLADDYMLGKLISSEGFQVILSPYAVDTVVCEGNFKSLFLRELRWERTVRTAQPIDHVFSVVTQALPASGVLLLLPHPSLMGLFLVSAMILFRILLHYVTRFKVPINGVSAAWLLPFRECLCFAVWVASFFGRSVYWRGQWFLIGPHGLLIAKDGARMTTDVPLQRTKP